MRSVAASEPSLRLGLWWGAWPGLAGMVLLGSSVAVIDATQHLPVLGVQAARYAVAAVALVVMARAFGIRLVLPRRGDIGWVIGGAMSGLVAFNLATIVGTRHAEPGLLGAAVACIPVALAVAGPLSQRRRPSPRVMTGAIIVSIGAVAVTGWGRGDVIGILMAAALIACETGFTLLGARALPRMGPWSYSAATAVVAAIIFAVLAAIIERTTPASFAEPATVAAILYLGAVATAVAFVLWFTGVQRLGPGTVGLCAGIAAPAAALIASLLGAPLPSFGAWLGMAVIAVGLVIGFLPWSRRPFFPTSRRDQLIERNT
ncbi:DMT family transporter [Agromyces albus]|uniref:DMT family transporter n=1 Tax=Agromyces albus TaxID=205332 RepID=UPI002785B712|nr:DMT family transporter [Agromyces albus]MDQ0576038.1 drug/metabolite transporter (DMT)-like permease [Agromyces albus]